MLKAAVALFLLVAALALLLPTNRAASAAEPRQGSIGHGGLNRTYIYYVPEVLPGTPRPLVFVLHGGGGTARQAMEIMTESRWNELADRDKFIVVYPQGVNNRWNDCRGDVPGGGSTADDVGFLSALIDDFAANYNIDVQRIYATGHSNGGMMSFRLAIELSDRIAAVYSNTGAMPAVNECAAPVNSVAIMYLAGTADPLIPFEGGPVVTRNGRGHGTVISAADTVGYWRSFLGTDNTPTVETVPDIVPGDDSAITIFRYGNGAQDTEVVYYRVDGGGHGWPDANV